MQDKPTVIFYGIKYFPSRGGTSRVAENIIRELSDKANITICCYKADRAKTNVPGVKAITFPEFPFGGAGVFVYFLISAIYLLFTQKRNVIIHAHKTDCAVFLPLLRLKFKKVIATSHEAPYKRDKWNRIGKSYFKLAEKIFVRSGAYVTSISKPLSEFYHDKYGKVVHYIPNGISTKFTFDHDQALKLLQQHSAEDQFVLFAARRIMSTKGLHTMLEALDLYNYKHPILICGDINHAPRYVSELKKKYKHLQTKWLGYVELPALLSLLGKASLFIFPSESEGMSMMLLESVSVGTPVICSDIPENSQILPGEAVLFFRDRDANDLQEKIAFAIGHPEQMKEKSIYAVSYVTEHYSWPAIAVQYLDIYQELLVSR